EHLKTFTFQDGIGAWNELNKAILTESRHRVNFLYTRLEKVEMKEGQNPQRLIIYISKLYRELEEAGEAITDRAKESMILKKLTQDYDSFISSYEQKPESEKSFYSLTSALRKDFLMKAYRNPTKYQLDTHNAKKKQPFKRKVPQKPLKKEANATSSQD